MSEDFAEAIITQKQAGGSIGDGTVPSESGEWVWVVSGRNGENLIRTPEATQDQTWRRDVEQARGVGMLGRKTGQGSRQPLKNLGPVGARSIDPLRIPRYRGDRMTSRPKRVSWLTEEFNPMRITRMAAQVFGVVAVVVGCLGVATTETKAGEFRGGNHNSGHHGGGHNGGGHNFGHHGGGFRPGNHHGGFRPGYGYGGHRPGWGGGFRPGYGGWNPRVGIPPINRPF